MWCDRELEGIGFFPGLRSSTCTLSCFSSIAWKKLHAAAFATMSQSACSSRKLIECGDHDHRAVPVGLAYVLEVVCDQRWDGLPFRIIVQLAVLAVLEPENKEAVASAKMGGFARSSVRCEHGMPGADSAAVVCHAAVEYVAQVRCRDGDGMAVAIGACRVAVLCTDAVAEDGIHAAFVEADPVVENRKNVLCLLGQRTLDRIDNKLSLSCQLATRQLLVVLIALSRALP